MVLPFAKDDILMLQDAKMFREDRISAASIHARALGWSPIHGRAHPTAGYGGTAGWSVLAREGMGIAPASTHAFPDSCEHRVLN